MTIRNKVIRRKMIRRKSDMEDKAEGKLGKLHQSINRKTKEKQMQSSAKERCHPIKKVNLRLYRKDESAARNTRSIENIMGD